MISELFGTTRMPNRQIAAIVSSHSPDEKSEYYTFLAVFYQTLSPPSCLTVNGFAHTIGLIIPAITVFCVKKLRSKGAHMSPRLIALSVALAGVILVALLAQVPAMAQNQ